MLKGIYAGTFDPMTIGHMDIIKRASNIVSNLYVAIAESINKGSIFDLNERVDMAEKYINQELPHAQNIEIIPFTGLLVELAHKLEAKIIFRGIRAVSDFEYEYQLACVNKKLGPDVQTLFLPASEDKQYISSRFVKEIARFGGDTSSFSSDYIVTKLKDYYNIRPNKEQTITD